ncbi:unnamed protein product [Boreogadus saida]
MVEDSKISKSSRAASFSSNNLHLRSPAAATPQSSQTSTSSRSVQSSQSQSSQSSGGMKLEAVMENLQRQQAARLALEEKVRLAEKEKSLRSLVESQIHQQALVESQIHQQALAFRHYQAAVRGALAAGGGDGSPAGLSPSERQLARMGVRDPDRAEDSDFDDGEEEEEEEEEGELGHHHLSGPGLDGQPRVGKRDPSEEDTGVAEDEGEDGELEAGSGRFPARHGGLHAASRSPLSRNPPSSPGAPLSQSHEWTYEEQFKQPIPPPKPLPPPLGSVPSPLLSPSPPPLGSVPSPLLSPSPLHWALFPPPS